MYFTTAMIEDEPTVVVANKDRTKFFTLDYLALELDFVPYTDLLEFIEEHDDEMIEGIRNIIETEEEGNIEPEEMELLPAIPYPLRNVFCMGLNYRDHASETNQDAAELPIYFSKAAFISAGPGDHVSTYSKGKHFADYEVELIVVIGKQAKRVNKEDVEECVFGYAVGQDFSIRDTQTYRKQWHYGKSYDGHFVMGNWIAHKSLYPLPIEVDINCYVNDELRQSSNTRLFICDIPSAINDLTQGVTLYPGDMLMTGTPAGVGVAMKPKYSLKVGDIVKSEVVGLETFENTMVK